MQASMYLDAMYIVIVLPDVGFFDLRCRKNNPKMNILPGFPSNLGKYKAGCCSCVSSDLFSRTT